MRRLAANNPKYGAFHRNEVATYVLAGISHCSVQHASESLASCCATRSFHTSRATDLINGSEHTQADTQTQTQCIEMFLIRDGRCISIIHAHCVAGSLWHHYSVHIDMSVSVGPTEQTESHAHTHTHTRTPVRFRGCPFLASPRRPARVRVFSKQIIHASVLRRCRCLNHARFE